MLFFKIYTTTTVSIYLKQLKKTLNIQNYTKRMSNFRILLPNDQNPFFKKISFCVLSFSKYHICLLYTSTHYKSIFNILNFLNSTTYYYYRIFPFSFVRVFLRYRIYSLITPLFLFYWTSADFLLCSTSVSYTHLDVYKRQMVYRIKRGF